MQVTEVDGKSPSGSLMWNFSRNHWNHEEDCAAESSAEDRRDGDEAEIKPNSELGDPDGHEHSFDKRNNENDKLEHDSTIEAQDTYQDRDCSEDDDDDNSYDNSFDTHSIVNGIDLEEDESDVTNNDSEDQERERYIEDNRRETSDWGGSEFSPISPECMVCGDEVTETTLSNFIINTSNEHRWCANCVREVCAHATHDETMYPPRCCELGDLNIECISHFLSNETLSKLDEMDEMKRTTNRTYCSNPQCARFLAPRLFKFPDTMTTCKCGTTTCWQCKKSQAEHNGACEFGNPSPEFAALVLAQGWKICPCCNTLIDKWVGCHHIQCRCGFHFCWLCQRRWKTCDCSQFGDGQQQAHEQYDLDEYEDMIQPEPIQPEPIQHNDNNLLCQHNDIPPIHGGARCQGPCGAYMPG